MSRSRFDALVSVQTSDEVESLRVLFLVGVIKVEYVVVGWNGWLNRFSFRGFCPMLPGFRFLSIFYNFDFS